MKKSTKIGLLLAGSFLVLGLLIGCIGLALGGKQQFRDVVEGTSLFDVRWNWGNHKNYDFKDSDFFHLDETLAPIITGSYTNENLADKSEVNALDIEFGGGEIEVKKSSTDKFGIKSNYSKRYQCYVSGGTLYLAGGVKNNIVGASGKITIYIPEGVEFDEVTLDVGAGVFSIADLKADMIQADIGAGQLNFKDIVVDELSMVVGAGAIEAKNMIAQNVSMEAGVGHIQYNGDINGDLDAECGLGAINLELDGKESDYNYNLICEMGTIDLAGETFGGLSMEREINNQADKTFDLECDMGNIGVKFN